MTDQRFERRLPAILEELYLGRTPDYREEVLATAVGTRQRPRWTFPGRWLPMTDIASRSAFAPRLPLRALGVALLLIALLLAALALVVGSRQTKVPPPFGLAGNGLVAYAADGDIYTLDPATGASTVVVSGPSTDTEPAFSPDGRLIAFRRVAASMAGAPEDIVVAGADGSNPIIITGGSIPFGPKRFEWAPDSASILAVAQDDSSIWLFNARQAEPPRTVATNAGPYRRPFRPPDGNAILIIRVTDTRNQLILLDLASGRETVLATGSPGNGDDLGSARWSPDGTQVVFNASPAGDPDSQRVFIVNADGTNAHQVTDVPGVWYDIDPTWSPNGRFIAFTRYERVGPGDVWDIRPTGIYSVADGSVTEAGPLPRDVRAQAPGSADGFATAGEGFYLEWSPDGTSLVAFPGEASGHAVVIHPVDGTWRLLDPVMVPGRPDQAWQRTAP